MLLSNGHLRNDLYFEFCVPVGERSISKIAFRWLFGMRVLLTDQLIQFVIWKWWLTFVTVCSNGRAKTWSLASSLGSIFFRPCPGACSISKIDLRSLFKNPRLLSISLLLERSNGDLWRHLYWLLKCPLICDPHLADRSNKCSLESGIRNSPTLLPRSANVEKIGCADNAVSDSVDLLKLELRQEKDIVFCLWIEHCP